jgi:4-hydroxybenzoate polyprenyltransferase
MLGVSRFSCDHMLADIKIAHSVFALPFALLGGAMVAWPPGGSGVPKIPGGDVVLMLVLVVVAMVAARTAAMLSNRLIDRELDARNPRTSQRPLACGLASVGSYRLGLAGASLIFILVAVIFVLRFDNPWPLVLSVPVLVWICTYGLFKRFTAWCHLWLGASLAISVPAAALAVNPTAIPVVPGIWLLAGMVLCWVAGFDVIYALQDIKIDCEEGLHSLPSRLGASGAIWVSRGLHVAAVVLLLMVWWLDQRLGVVFLTGVGVVAALLLIEHATVRRWGTTKMAMTFFTLNGVVSCVLGLTGIIDLLNCG